MCIRRSIIVAYHKQVTARLATFWSKLMPRIVSLLNVIGKSTYDADYVDEQPVPRTF